MLPIAIVGIITLYAVTLTYIFTTFDKEKLR